MKILIIGGTKFLGRHFIAAAIKREHEVTLFNRGNTYSDVKIPYVEQIRGDRNVDLDRLRNGIWDACIDTCGYLPQSVRTSAELLKARVEQYVFISSGSVYSDTTETNYDEDTPTSILSKKQQKEVKKIDPKSDLTGPILGENYGALKRLCELAAERVMPNRVLSVRAGMIVGSFDPTDRFTYWVMRVAKGGEVLAPGSPENPVQLIDARDLSKWVIEMVEINQTGIFNITSKPFELTFEKMLGAIKEASESDAEFTWTDDDFLNENDVAPWSDMPFYLPESNKKFDNFLTMDIDKALQKVLRFDLCLKQFVTH